MSVLWKVLLIKRFWHGRWYIYNLTTLKTLKINIWVSKILHQSTYFNTALWVYSGVAKFN